MEEDELNQREKRKKKKKKKKKNKLEEDGNVDIENEIFKEDAFVELEKVRKEAEFAFDLDDVPEAPIYDDPLSQLACTINENPEAPTTLGMENEEENHGHNAQIFLDEDFKAYRSRNLPKYIVDHSEQITVRRQVSQKKHSMQKRWRDEEEEIFEESEELIYDTSRISHFISLQITDATLKRKLKTIQDSIASRFPDLAQYLVDPKTFHFTIIVLNLHEEDLIWSALGAFEQFGANRLEKILETRTSCKLTVQGLGHFRKRVLYADLNDDKARERLKKIHHGLCNEFVTNDIPGDFRKRFEPHCTLLKLPPGEELPKDLLALLPSFSAKIGTQFLHRLDFCIFQADKAESGYYDSMGSVQPSKLF